MVNREVVGAHYGLRDWLAQRITAVVMLIYTLMLLGLLVMVPSIDFWHWKALWAIDVMRYATVVFLASLFYHAWVGMRNICMDYVKDAGLRLTLYAVVILALTWYAAWALQILWGM